MCLQWTWALNNLGFHFELFFSASHDTHHLHGYLTIQIRCLLLKEHFLPVLWGRLLISGMDDEMFTVNMLAVAHCAAQRYPRTPLSNWPPTERWGMILDILVLRGLCSLSHPMCAVMRSRSSSDCDKKQANILNPNVPVQIISPSVGRSKNHHLVTP